MALEQTVESSRDGDIVYLPPDAPVLVKTYIPRADPDVEERRGQIEKMEPRPGNVSVVTAFVPLSEMFGYTTDLRSATQGRATSSMHFERYAEAPRNVAEEIIAKVKGASS